jgi:hypothetical protein
MKPRLTPEEAERALYSLEQNMAISRLEGMEPPPGAQEILKMHALGMITTEQVSEIARKLAFDEITPEQAIALAKEKASE